MHLASLHVASRHGPRNVSTNAPDVLFGDSTSRPCPYKETERHTTDLKLFTILHFTLHRNCISFGNISDFSHNFITA